MIMRLFLLVTSSIFVLGRVSGQQVVLEAAPSVSGLASLQAVDSSTIGRETFLAGQSGDRARLFLEMSPYTAVVRNTSTTPIAALMLLYEVTDYRGRTTTAYFLRDNIDSPSAAFNPGDAYLVTPLGEEDIARPAASASYGSNVSSGSDIVTSASGAGMMLSPTASQVWDARMARIQKAKLITISIDSVLTADGTLWGPDKANSFERFNAWSSVTVHTVHRLWNHANSGRWVHGVPRQERRAGSKSWDRILACVGRSGYPKRCRSGKALKHFHRESPDEKRVGASLAF